MRGTMILYEITLLLTVSDESNGGSSLKLQNPKHEFPCLADNQYSCHSSTAVDRQPSVSNQSGNQTRVRQ
jgi:hypothetical protein